MLSVDGVIERIGDEVETLTGRVEGALQLASLIKNGAMPAVTPAAYVLPLGLRGMMVTSAAGMFRQGLEENVGVLLFVESPGDPTGVGALPDITALVGEIVKAVAGWAPEGAFGQFRVARANLVSLAEGMAIYQIDFAIEQQLRLPTQE